MVPECIVDLSKLKKVGCLNSEVMEEYYTFRLNNNDAKFKTILFISYKDATRNKIASGAYTIEIIIESKNNIIKESLSFYIKKELVEEYKNGVFNYISFSKGTDKKIGRPNDFKCIDPLKIN